MRPTDRVEFVKILNGMSALKPGGKLSPEAINLFWNAMQAWTIEEFREAANHLVQSCEFMPNPYHFAQLRKAGELTAPEAWSEALGSCVNWRNPEYLPTGRVARAAAAVGGFRTIAMADRERDLPFIEKRFKEAYDELTDVESVREALPQIAKPEARIALRGPVHAAKFIPDLKRPESRKVDNSPNVAQRALLAPRSEPPKPTKSPREKITALVKLHADFTPEDIARIAGESVETVREVMAELENAA